MSPYENDLVKYLREMEEKMNADNNRVDAFIGEKCKEHYDKLWRDL